MQWITSKLNSYHFFWRISTGQNLKSLKLVYWLCLGNRSIFFQYDSWCRFFFAMCGIMEKSSPEEKINKLFTSQDWSVLEKLCSWSWVWPSAFDLRPLTQGFGKFFPIQTSSLVYNIIIFIYCQYLLLSFK